MEELDFIGFGFTLFNGALGIVYSSVWNGSICVYYILLAIIRGIIVNSKKNGERKGSEEYQRRRIYVITHIIET